MQRILKIFFFLLLFAIVICNALFPDNIKHIEIDKREYNLGTVFQKQRVPFHFLLTNKGKKDLVIYAVAVDCDCILLSDITGPIPMDKSITLKGIMDTSFYTDEIEKVIVLTTNDPANQKIQLLLKGSIINTVDFYPFVLQLSGFIHNTGKFHKEVVLTHCRRKKFRIYSVNIPAPFGEAISITYDPGNEETKKIVDFYIDQSRIKTGNFSLCGLTVEFTFNSESGLTKEYYDIILYKDTENG